MNRRQGWLFFIIFLLTFSIYLLINFPLQLGLDLKGGSQLTLQLIKDDGIVTNEELEAVNAVLDKRVNNLGVAESNLQTLGRDQLILELPGEQNPLSASRILGKTALLEFRTQKEDTSPQLKNLQLRRFQINDLIDQYISIDKRNDDKIFIIDNNLTALQNDINYSSSNNDLFDKLIDTKKYINNEIATLFIKTDLSGKDLINAGRRQEQTNNNWEVSLSFSNEGGEKFAEITKSIAGTNQLLSIVLDGESISEASVGSQFINTGITGGSATISGNFSAENARELEVQLKGGSLPLPIEIVETNTIGPSLGSENIAKSLYAAIFGLIFVGVFMIFNYRILGFVSVISLIFYGFFNLALYSLIPVTLTLPGIAGLILSIGMAVDANVLIFSRIREELKMKDPQRAIRDGFSRAFVTIFDANVTTLITALILYFIGTGPVKGFAITLSVGIVTSMFTAIMCTRAMVNLVYGNKNIKVLKI